MMFHFFEIATHNDEYMINLPVWQVMTTLASLCTETIVKIVQCSGFYVWKSAVYQYPASKTITNS